MEGDLGRKRGRYTQEVAEYAERLQEVDERTRDAPLDMVECKLERVRDSMDSAPVRTSPKRHQDKVPRPAADRRGLRSIAGTYTAVTRSCLLRTRGTLPSPADHGRRRSNLVAERRYIIR
jgi:hypothetical protein